MMDKVAKFSNVEVGAASRGGAAGVPSCMEGQGAGGPSLAGVGREGRGRVRRQGQGWEAGEALGEGRRLPRLPRGEGGSRWPP